jgi:hypothetical protein
MQHVHAGHRCLGLVVTTAWCGENADGTYVQCELLVHNCAVTVTRADSCACVLHASSPTLATASSVPHGQEHWQPARLF